MKLASIFFTANESIFLAQPLRYEETSEKYQASWTSQVLRQVLNIYYRECKYLLGAAIRIRINGFIRESLHWLGKGFQNS